MDSCYYSNLQQLIRQQNCVKCNFSLQKNWLRNHWSRINTDGSHVHIPFKQHRWFGSLQLNLKWDPGNEALCFSFDKRNTNVLWIELNCFCGMVGNRRKAFSLISSWDHYQRSSPSRISDTPRAGFEPAQNLSSGLVEWSCAVVINTTPILISFLFFSNSNLFSFFFFNFSKKRKLDFIHFHCVFSISILFPAFPPRFPAFPPLFPSFPPWFPGFSLWFPVFQPRFPTFPPLFYFLHSHPHSPHFPHSVPRFLIPAFTDSHNILCIKITWAI